MSAHAAPPSPVARPPRPRGAVRPAPPPPAAVGGGAARREAAARRAAVVVALAGLLVLCLVRWFALVQAAPAGRAVAFALASAAAGAALARSAAGRPRALVAAVFAVALVAAALLAAGTPAAMLSPRHWGALAAGLGDGVSALPGVTVPYRGLDPWAGIAILAGGCLLAAAAGLAAGWRRRGGAAGARGCTILALGVLFAIPAVELTTARPWVVGAVFALGICVLLLADRVPRGLAGAGGAVVVVAVLAGMALGPALDRDGPIVDLQRLASRLEAAHPDRFDWSHGYGPLTWPRDGRVLLRVKAPRPSYWKAEDLELFDGVRWRAATGGDPLLPTHDGLARHPSWRERVRVTLGGMSSHDFIAPGEILSISHAPARPVSSRPGGFEVGLGHRDLTDGDGYVAVSYVPRPTPAMLRAAPATYPGYLVDDLSMLTPPDGSMGRTTIRFAPFGSGLGPIASGPGVRPGAAAAVLRRSGYGRTYDLARRLAAASATPYDLVQHVERYLAQPAFAYDEQPPRHRLPLPAFLFADRVGYCQHFSGAMALLLRMGGIPARVAGGFTSGRLDAGHRAYVVRDLDAHSWVEAWFAGIGWVTFDPTPGIAPARSQGGGGASAVPGVVPGGPQPFQGRVGGDPGPGVAAAAATPSGGGGSPWLAVAVVAGAAALASGALAVRRRVRRARGRRRASEVEELERALRRTGRRVAPATTLLALERRFAASPGARDYVRAVAARRYAADAVAGPNARDRRALRRELARGLGLGGTLRAWWALPPRPGRRRRPGS